ncbi:MaoC/PaaZ C-terminal domain-containing protein [Oceanobacillus halotolerans]|uniref:MaoC/PaaZ C-terminal domain-containing protein n=1 Tax=Oceanobacillus halotolerans TaxID=2663380 RepID=UPI0013D8FC11|nr:MaoC/PaaZ C-terminal domain-containing protein [Oceanobacillus halotolerans]
MIGKKRKLGKKINELQVGDTYTASHIIEDKELLLYLGLTNDANPLYIQHDYASQTPYEQPIVPSVMLFGMVSSIVSMHLPGPGSHIVEHEITFPKPVYHYSEVKFTLEITDIDKEKHTVNLTILGFNVNGEEVMNGTLQVCPPYEPNSITAQSLENFF